MTAAAILNPGIGHNRGSALDRLPEALRQLGEFLKERPVIQDTGTARQAAALVKAAKAILAEVEDERKEQTQPLNEQLREINDRYRQARQTVEQTLIVLSDRLSDFAKAEERRRLMEAEEKRKAAEEAAKAAYEAEAAKADALDNAAAGECGVDVEAILSKLSAATAQAGLAAREADRAKRDAHVRLSAGHGRALSLRSQEILFITDPTAAIATLGMTEQIQAAILTAARAYRQLRGELPPGVSSRQKRSI